MPTVVDIPKVGEVEFPDSMDDAAIEKAIHEHILPSSTPASSPSFDEPLPSARVRPAYLTPPPLAGVTTPIVGAPGTFARGASEAASGLVEGATSGAGLGIMAAQAVPGLNVAVNTALLAAGVKQAAQELGDYSVTGDPEKLGQATVMGAALTAPFALKAAKALLSRPVAALDETPLAQGEQPQTLKGGQAPETAAPTAAAEPLGLLRPAKPDASLQSLSEDEFSTQRKAVTRQLEQAEGDDVDFSKLAPEQRSQLGALQDKYTAFELEAFRRGLKSKVTEDLFHEALGLTDHLDPEEGVSKLSGKEDFHKLGMLLDELETRRGDPLVENWLARHLAGSADAREVYAGRYQRLRALAALRQQPAKQEAAPEAATPAANQTPAQKQAVAAGLRQAITPQKSAELEKDLRKEGWNVTGVGDPDNPGAVAFWEVRYRAKKISEADTASEGWRKIMDGEVAPPGEPTDYEKFVSSELNRRMGVATSPGESATASPAPINDAALQSPVAESPTTPESRPFGIMHPGTARFVESLRNAFAPLAGAAREMEWKTFAQQTAPRITEADRLSGELAAELAAAPRVGRMLGEQFADDVTRGLPVNDTELARVLQEDNLRSIRQGFEERARAEEARAVSNPNESTAALEAAELYKQAAGAVNSHVGEGSYFADEAAYREALARNAKVIERHKQLWVERKEPLYREAADIDPETPLATRGLETRARINLVRVEPKEGAKPVAGAGSGLKQLGTLIRRDPYARMATGMGEYEPSYREMMARSFEREYPVGAQHKFLRQLVASGVGAVDKSPVPIEGQEAFPLRIRPWQSQYLHLPGALAAEYKPIAGLAPKTRIPVVSNVADFLTRQSIQGLGEGSAHSANLLLKVFSGVGPTASPWANAALKTGAWLPTMAYSVTRAVMRGLRPDSEGMLELAKINATKQPYRGAVSGKLLDPLDKGIRLVSKDIFEGMAERGIVKDTPTNLREFVNEIGNYTRSTQSPLVRLLRDTGVQPFATGFRTATAQAVKRLALAPGVKATSPGNALALRADVLGGFVGAAVTIGALNWLISGKARGLPGTRLGSVSWQDTEGKTHEIDVGGLTGLTTGARRLGVMGAIEAKERGLPAGIAAGQAARGLATTATSQLAGPVVRFGTIALTGHDSYGNQIARPSPTGNPVNNVVAAARSVNPIVDMIAGMHEGKSWEETRQRQLTRYAPYSPSGVQTSERFPEIVEGVKLKEYGDQLAAKARKLNMEDRMEFVLQRLDEDKVEGAGRKQVLEEIKRKGVLKYE